MPLLDDASTAPAAKGDSQHLSQRLQAKYADRITGSVLVPGRAGSYAPLAPRLARGAGRGAATRGIDQLYSHQAEAWHAVREGKHVVVVTPTASGKTLCYTLPVVAGAMSRQAKALYLFPTKALAQDQVAELLELNRAGELGVQGLHLRRRHARRCPPGGAHCTATSWSAIRTCCTRRSCRITPSGRSSSRTCEYVVIDEMHTYRGVFGSHVANVLRRLRRVCAFYGVEPQFILCSATIGNPQAHAEALIEAAKCTAITESGAPTGDKHVLLWNPPVVNPDLGLRASARSQSNRIARLAIRAGLKTMVFAQSRTMVEVLTKYLKDVFDHDPRKPARIRAYRGGYLPTERRDAEKAMRDGRDRRHRQHLRAGTGRGHRQPGRGRPQRLSGHGRRHLAALRPRRAAAEALARRAGGQQRAARPVPGPASRNSSPTPVPSTRASIPTSP